MTGRDPSKLDTDAGWDRAERDETQVERLDRNWSDLLQELRVTQTGVQLLTGFLLTLPFQQRFTLLDSQTRTAYVVTVVAAVLATIALVGPVSFHRLLFRQHARRVTVVVGHRLAITGLVLLGIAMSGTVEVILSMVEGDVAGVAAGASAAALFVLAWFGFPLLVRLSDADRSDP